MVSIIIPVFNEKANIRGLEKSLKGLIGEFEVIFSDGFSSDGTYDDITFPKIQEAKYRSNQMNAAAKHAKGDILWFIHADSRLHKDSIKRIEASDAQWGCFKLRFDSKKILMKIVAFNSGRRVKRRSIIFGDQGIFIRKSLFEAIGGYTNIPLMEDYKLSMDLKEMGIKPQVINLPITTSPRRFEKNGIWRTIFLMQKLQRDFRNGRDADALHREYENPKGKRGENSEES